MRKYCGVYTDWLRAARSGDRIPLGAKFCSPVRAGPGTHPGSCTIGTGSIPGVKSSRGVTLTPYLLLVPWSWKSRAIHLLPLWAVRPVQSLSASTRVTFTFFFVMYIIFNVLNFSLISYDFFLLGTFMLFFVNGHIPVEKQLPDIDGKKYF
jgi:hypothetical protein